MAQYMQQFAEALKNYGQQKDPTMQQYEQELMKPQDGNANAHLVSLVDNLTGSNFSSQLPKKESMKDRLAQLLQLRQGVESQKLSGLGKLADIEANAADKALQRQYQERMLGLQMMKARSGRGAGGLKPTEIAKFNEGNNAPLVLKDLHGLIDSNADIFGPIAGRIAGNNPWNEQSKTIDAQLRQAAQVVGSYLEGGKLMKDDEVKYRNMLPNLADSPEVAKNKLTLVERLIAQRQNSNLDALRGGGYDVSSIDQGLEVPALPHGGAAPATRNPSAAPRAASPQGLDYDSMDPAEVEARYRARFGG
jgi:hypothetical protein